jgi:hypothetical protein
VGSPDQAVSNLLVIARVDCGNVCTTTESTAPCHIYGPGSVIHAEAVPDTRWAAPLPRRRMDMRTTMTDQQQEQIDFTMMYVTHDALRRDVGRFAAAAATGRANTPAVRAGWKNFKAQLHVHHTVEDDDLWPRLYRAVADRPEDLAMLEAMEAEHAVLDPMLESVEASLADGDQRVLAERVDALAAALEGHLLHEEKSALPLIQSVLTPADWRAFGGAMRRRQGLRGAAVYVPWIVDGATPADRNRFFSALPRPLQVINRLLLEPRYRHIGLWGV